MAKAADGTLLIRVVRSGGFAGLRREWRAETDDGTEWLPLIQACPWNQPPAQDLQSADRYIWRIEVRAPRLRRSATVPDASLEGPWRLLVDHVQHRATSEESL